MAAEIDRVVAEGRAAGRLTGKQPLGKLVGSLVRCAELDGQRYCLGLGWTDLAPAQARAQMTVAARATRARRDASTTGDLDALGELRRTASLSPAARAAAERRELTDAARSVAKVWVLRHDDPGRAAARRTSSASTRRPGRRPRPAARREPSADTTAPAAPTARDAEPDPHPVADRHGVTGQDDRGLPDQGPGPRPRARPPSRRGPTGAARRRCR